MVQKLLKPFSVSLAKNNLNSGTNALVITIRLIAVTIVYFVSFIVVSAALLSTPPEQPDPERDKAAVIALLAISLMNTAVFAYIILRSRWAGWKLAFTIFVVFYGVTTVMSQIETAFFVTRLPPGMLPRLFLAGAIIAAVFAPLSVLILGRAKGQTIENDGYSRLNIPVGEWVGRLSLIVVAYVLIYFTFGYYIAWKNPAVRVYYGGTDPGSFIAQISSVLHDSPSLFLLQAARALLWAGIALLVIQMMKGKWWEAGLAVALLFSVVATSPLLLPNPFMPYEVRMVHLLETATSNFVFGWLVALILLGWRQSRNT